jgi:two-component system, chemotaxis family, chemotaxis protein CheY
MPSPRPFAVNRLGAMGGTILVVEDERWMRELLQLHLSNAGYAVLAAEDAIAAGRMLLWQQPDLILTDVQMPFMDGLEFIQAVKADPRTAAIPAIFLTCSAEVETQARHIGAADFLRKPVRADQLLAAVAKQVGGRVALATAKMA